jgi:hypothetical protein
MDFKYYQINGGDSKNGRETAKQIHVKNNDNNKVILKKDNTTKVNTYTFKNGMKRQWFTSHYENEANMVDVLTNNTTTNHKKHFFFVKHNDDKIFHKYRYALKVENTTTYYNNDGTQKKNFHPFVVYDIVNESNIKYTNITGTIRREYGNSYEIQEITSQSILICEKWVKWGMFEILLDNGVEKSTKYLYDDPQTSRNVKSSSFLPLTDMRCCGVNNPFDDPYEPELKEMRDKRNEFKEQIAMEVFKPERVMRMIETFGDDWMEKV